MRSDFMRSKNVIEMSVSMNDVFNLAALLCEQINDSIRISARVHDYGFVSCRFPQNGAVASKRSDCKTHYIKIHSMIKIGCAPAVYSEI